MSLSPYEFAIKKAKDDKTKQEEAARKVEKPNARMVEVEARLAAIRREEHNQKIVTYKIFTGRRDIEVKADEIPALLARKEIKPDSRIYNNETNQWIDFKDYKRLHTILKMFPAEQPKDEDTYKVLLEGKSHELTIYRIERLLRKGTIKPDTRIFNNETNSWIDLKEYGGLYKRINTLDSHTNSLSQKGSNTSTSQLLMECPKCNHSYSKRADKCPKCGNTASASCNICKAEIPKNSNSCPECGDPSPCENVSDWQEDRPIGAKREEKTMCEIPQALERPDSQKSVIPKASISWLLLSLDGRIGRKHFWCCMIPVGVSLSLLLSVAEVFRDINREALFGGSSTPSLGILVILLLLAIPLGWANWAIQVKRLHDRDKSWRWLFLYSIPIIGNAWGLIELGFLPGNTGENTYGPNHLS